MKFSWGRRARTADREARRHVDAYNEGRRLMRHGDGADEWIGMKIARDALLALTGTGRDETGRLATEDEIAATLRKHGLGR